MKNEALDFEAVCEIAKTLRGVEEATIHGVPSLKARGKLLACPAIHKSAEPNSLVVRMSPEKRDALIASNPATYYLTDHYIDFSMVLARLSKLNEQSLLTLLQTALEMTSTRKGVGIRRAVPKSASRKRP